MNEEFLIVDEDIETGEFLEEDIDILSEAKAVVTKDTAEFVSARIAKIAAKIAKKNDGKLPTSFTVKEIKGGKKAVEAIKEAGRELLIPTIIAGSLVAPSIAAHSKGGTLNKEGRRVLNPDKADHIESAKIKATKVAKSTGGVYAASAFTGGVLGTAVNLGRINKYFLVTFNDANKSKIIIRADEAKTVNKVMSLGMKDAKSLLK